MVVAMSYVKGYRLSTFPEMHEGLHQHTGRLLRLGTFGRRLTIPLRMDNHHALRYRSHETPWECKANIATA